MPYKDRQKQRLYQRLWKNTRKAQYFADKKCAHCGCITNLELHHLNPETKVSHRIWSWSSDRRKAELAKCQILCRTCHGKMRRKAKHGTKTMYTYGCRCASCTEAKRQAAREYRKRLSYEK